jgi:hypothetical protein
MFPKVNPKQSFLEMESVFDVWNLKKKEISALPHDEELYF